MHDTIALPQLAAALRELCGAESPNYRQLWLACVDGKIPSTTVAGRHRIRRTDLPKIAAAMGMQVVPASRAKRHEATAA